MDFELSKAAVEMTSKNNELLVDKFNNPSVMVKIPKMKMSELIKGGSENPHPAFIVDGAEKDFIYISKYPNTMINGSPCSIPLDEPDTGFTYDEAKELCESKGSGWHLMTNAEWSLLLLLAQKNNTEPYGNNNKGEDITIKDKGVILPESEKTLTGSGSILWSHDHTQSGIFDLNGNVNEWISGIRLNEGQIQVLTDNNAASGSNTGEQSTLWKTINTDGSYGEKDEIENTYFYKYTSTPSENGQIELSETQGDIQENEEYYGEIRFERLIKEKPDILIALGLATFDSTSDKGDVVRIKNSGERLARRGGCYSDGEKAGIGCLDLTVNRDYKSVDTGFRACYIPT